MKKILIIIISMIVCSQISNSQEIEESAAIKCGTFKNNISKFQDKQKKLNDPSLQKKLFNREYDTLPLKFTSPSGRFLIHYDNKGVNAVSDIDKNKNGISDYVDSIAAIFDYVYNKEVTEIGYKAPPKDYPSGGGDEYDIYVIDIGNNVQKETYYGFTTPGDSYNIPNKATIYNSFIVVDNNYSENDSTLFPDHTKKRTYYTNGIDALKVTAAHEFHHAVQFGYGFPMPDMLSINEMTSTFMEYRVYPELKDHYGYVRKLLSNFKMFNFGNDSVEVGYSWMIFFKKIYLENQNDNVLLDMWSNISDNIPAYQSLELSLQKNINSNISKELREVAVWLYHTGVRSVDNMYFPESREYPLMTFYRNEYYSNPSFMDSGYMKPYEFKPMRLLFQTESNTTGDTLDMILINDDFISANTKNKTENEYQLSISEKINDCDSLIMNNRFCYKNVSTDHKVIPVFFEYNSVKLIDENFVFPNPFTVNDNYIAFPVRYSAKFRTKVNLSIFDIENKQLYSKQLLVGEFEKRKVVLWNDIPEDISSGIYLYKIDYGDGEEIGKFSVRR